MANKKYVEIIWFISHSSYYWVSIPLDNQRTTIKMLLDMLPWSVDMNDYVVGIWGKQVKVDQVVTAGDRIELYKPLQLTPNDIRLRRKNQTD